MRKVLIIEFTDFHEEIISSQIDFLSNSSYEVHLFVNEKILLKGLSFSNTIINTLASSTKIKRLFSLYTVLKYIENHKINIVVYNTFENKYTKILHYLLPAKVNQIAIVHNIDKFEKNKMNIKNFLVLSENVFINMNSEDKKKYKINYFYPLIYNYKKQTNKEDKQINICIPGQIEFSRRDYLGLIQVVKNSNFKNINFTILGNIDTKEGKIVLENIKKYNLEKYFTLYHGFIPYNEYFRKLITSDLIMPLIHPSIDNYDKYHTTKISASFSMSFSFKIPLLIYSSFSTLEEFKDFSIFYDLVNFENIVNNIERNKILVLKEKLSEEEKFSFKHQKNQYIDYLEKING